MIDFLRGTVTDVDGHRIVVSVHGIGFAISVPMGSCYQKDHETTILTYMHWNQEQGPSLYGFSAALERTIFVMILECSGIGPKIALAVLANLGVERFLAAVQNGAEKELSSVSGIGAKKAEQMIVHLKHKVAKLIKSGVSIAHDGASVQWQEVVQVLESLNYSKPEISEAIKYVRETYQNSSPTFDQLIRHALSFLAKKS